MQNHSRQIKLAKNLRKNMSDTERKFWYRINRNQLGITFRRQHPIGPYITDFACIAKKLVIEQNGDQHTKNIQYDNAQTEFLESRGYTVIRIPNSYLTRGEIDAFINILVQMYI